MSAAPELRPARVLRGLVLGLALSAANLAGAFLTIFALGGLGEWTPTQFIGLFGLVEIGAGAAFVLGPNIWRLPVAEAEIAPREHVRLAASTVLTPHWAGGVKSIAGAALLAWAVATEGLTTESLGLPAIACAVCLAALSASALAARTGVAHPGADVVRIVVQRPGKPDLRPPAQSIGASIVQLLLNIGVFPLVKVLPPSTFYQPEVGPSPATLGWAAGISGALLVATVIAWHGRISWRAPGRQQQEAEALARAP